MFVFCIHLFLPYIFIPPPPIVSNLSNLLSWDFFSKTIIFFFIILSTLPPRLMTRLWDINGKENNNAGRG